MMRYKPIRYYKKFKNEYRQFVLFIKCGKYYITYDSDAKIVSYVCNIKLDENKSLIIEKTAFSELLKSLHEKGLNVVLAGSKKTREYYTTRENKYMKIRGYSRKHDSKSR